MGTPISGKRIAARAFGVIKTASYATIMRERCCDEAQAIVGKGKMTNAITKT